jgi:RNA polymerase sigma-70 factor (ECF subfamily)
MVEMSPVGSSSLEPFGHRHGKEPFHLIADMDAAGTDKQVVIDHLSDKAKYDFGLISRALDKHDQAAFAELMERYREPIYYMLLKMVNSQDDAEDLMIETFGKAFRRLKQYSPKFAFSTWLFKIASNGAIDFIRKKRIKALSLDKGFTDAEGDTMEIQVADDGLDPGQSLEKQQRVNRMREVVAQLKPRYRRLVELRYFEEYSYDEIAAELNLPLGTVKAQLFRARDILAGVLETDREQF